MTLEGAKFICLDKAGNHGETVLAKGRKFTMGYYVSCDYVLVDERAKGVHCEIECDAFGRVTIRNLSPDKPILVNGSAVEIKRSLLNNSKLSILDKEYLWLFSKSCSNEFEDIQREITSTPLKQIGIPEQPPNSCPDFKLHRDLPKRFTVHNFAYYIHSDDESNISNDESTSESNQTENENKNESKDSSENTSQSTEKEKQKRSITPEPNNELVKSTTELLETPKSNIINCSQDKENKSTEKKNKQLLTLCHQSDVVITSFSPRETGVKTEKSFAIVIKPKLLVTKRPTTPKSVYSTPKGDIGEDDENERDLITFHTPSTSKKGGVQSNTCAKTLKNSSMYLIDLTTPNKLAPTSPYPKSALKFSNKKKTQIVNKSGIKSSSDEQLSVTALPDTPTVVNEASNSPLVTPSSVITVNSSKDTSSVIEVTSDGSNMAITSGGSAHVPKTPLKAQTCSGVNTPKRTPHSLMKRALLTSAKKQNTTSQTNTQKLNTPRKENINRTPLPSNFNLSTSQLPRNQSISTPTREVMSAKTAHFDNTPSTSNLASSAASPSTSYKMSPRRSSINPISAAKALPTSTPMSCLKNKFALKSDAACRTSSLHKVRKSLGGIPLSSHISKARKSIAQSSTSLKITSIKEKSPQQVMSNRLVVRARNSLCITPFSARSRQMFDNQSTCPSSINKDKTTRSARKPDRKVVLFASQRPLDGSEVDNLSRTFIIDSDEEENVDTKKRQEKPKDAKFSPAKDANEKNETNKLNQTIEIPVDVEEVGLTKEKKTNECEDKEKNNVIELPEKVNNKDNSAAPHSDSDKMKAIVTEESFAEVINDYQEKCNLGDTIEIVDSPTKQSPYTAKTQESFIEDVDKINEKTTKSAKQNLIKTLKQDNNNAGNVETGFGEESSVEISQIPKGSLSEEYNPNNGENNKATDDIQEQRNTCKNSPHGKQTDLIQKPAEETKTSVEQKRDEPETCEYKPIVEDITLEGSFIEKELAKDNEEIVVAKELQEQKLKSEEIKVENAEIVTKESKDNEQLSTSSKVCAIKDPLEKLQLDDVEAETNIQQTKEMYTDIKEKEITANDQTKEVEGLDKSERFDLVETLKSNAVNVQTDTCDKNETETKVKLSETQTEPSKIFAVNEEMFEKETAKMSKKENDFQTGESAQDETAADLGDTNKLLEEIEDVLNKSDEMKQKHLDDLEECSDKPLTEEFESENTDEVEDAEVSKLEENTLNNGKVQEISDAQIIQLNKEDNNVNESSEGELENIDNAATKSETNSESKDQELKTSDTTVSLSQREKDAINETSETANNENDIQNQTNVAKPEVVVTESIANEGEIVDAFTANSILITHENTEENTQNITIDIPKQSENINENEINSKEKTEEEEIIQFVQKNQKIDGDDREENIIIESESKCSSPAKESKELEKSVLNLKQTDENISEVQNYRDIKKKLENAACFTPRCIPRHNSQLTNTPEPSAEPTISTPKRSSRRASISAESPMTSTPTKTSRRRASLSCNETLLTPQRITRRRSSISIDDETSKPSTSKLHRAKTPRKQFEQSLVIPEEVVDEVAGVIILDDDEEQKQEQIHFKENKCRPSILLDDATDKISAAVKTPKARTPGKQLEKSMVVLEEVDEKEIENKEMQKTSTEELLEKEPPMELKTENKKHKSVSISDKKRELPKEVSQILITNEKEEENVVSEQQQRASEEHIEIIVLEDDSDVEEIREDFTIVQGHTADNLNKPEARTPSERHESSAQQSEISDQIVAQEVTPKVVEDHNIVIEISSECHEEKASLETPNRSDLAESSSNVEQQEISSPSAESNNKISHDIPKSPSEQLKTPKPKAGTASVACIGELAYTPKDAVLTEEEEKGEEELTKLAVVADLMETPETNISENLTSVCKQELKTVDDSSKPNLVAAQTPQLGDVEREVVLAPHEGLENEGEGIEKLAVEKTPATPKNKKRVTLLVESPKTPAMTFVRDLLKTPKREMPTPKENTDNAQEKIVAELAKTPQSSKNNQNVIEEMPSSSVKTPATPKDKRRVILTVESPKTPAMTFVRDLLKTPKREMSTPKEAGKRDLVLAHKENTETEQDIEKCSTVAQLVETPQAYKNEQNLIGETPATPKDKKRVTFVVESPKTPAMTFVRGLLLKTPKREMRTPNENTENEQEEIEQISMVKQLVETPQDTKNNQYLAEEMPSSSMKNINLKGVKELLKTPKTCTTPRFRGIRELMQTPKASSSPIISGVKELLESPNTLEASEISVSKQLSEEISSAATTSENVDNFKGVKELLKTPKCSSTPRLKGIKELMKTPKTSSTPLLSGIKELMDTPAQQKDSHELDKFLRTPTAKNVMIPSMPASAIIEKRSDSIEVSTEYDLNATNVDGSINLEELFKAPVAAHFAERITESYYGEHEEEIDEQFTRTSNESLQDILNKSAEEAFDKLVGQETQIQTPVRKRYECKGYALQTPQTKSPFTGSDILSDLPRSDVEEWIETLEQAEPPTILACDDSDEEQKAFEREVNESVKYAAEESALTYSVNEQDSNESIIPETCTKVYLTDNSYTTKATESKDPLSNTHKKVKEKPTGSSLATSIDAEISGINLLDQTFESLPDEPSMLEEPLFVDEPSMFEEALVVSDNESEAENALNYSNDLSEPLLVSDSEDLNHSQEAETNEMLRIENALEMMQAQNELLQTSNLTLNEQEKSMLEKAPNVVDSMAEDPLETANQNEISTQLIREDKALIEIAISQSEDECEEKALAKPEHSFPLEDCSINDLFTNENIESEFFETAEQQGNSVILEDFSTSKLTEIVETASSSSQNDPTDKESIIESINAEIDAAATDEYNDAKEIAIEHTKLMSVESRDPPSVTEICEETNLFNEEPAERKENVSSKECQDIFLDNSNTDEAFANEENEIAVTEVVESTENYPSETDKNGTIIPEKGTAVVSEEAAVEAELSDGKLEETLDELKDTAEKTLQIETQSEATSVIDVDALEKNTLETLVIEDESPIESQTEAQTSKTTDIQLEPSETTTINEEVLPHSSKISEEIKSDLVQDLSMEDKTSADSTQSLIGKIITIPEREFQESEVDSTSETEKTDSCTESMTSEAVPKPEDKNEVLEIPGSSNANCSQKSDKSSNDEVIFQNDELNPTQSLSDEIITIPERELQGTEDLTSETGKTVRLPSETIKDSATESISSEAVPKPIEYKNEDETNEILEIPGSSNANCSQKFEGNNSSEDEIIFQSNELNPTQSLSDEIITIPECELQETEKIVGLTDAAIKDSSKEYMSSEAVPKPMEYKNEDEVNEILEIPGSSNEALEPTQPLIDEVVTVAECELQEDTEDLTSEMEKIDGLTDDSIKDASKESMSSEVVPKPIEYKNEDENNEILEIPGSSNSDCSQKSDDNNSSDDKAILQSETLEPTQSVIDELVTVVECELQEDTEEDLTSETEKTDRLTDESIKNSSQESMSSEAVPKLTEYKNNEILEIPESSNENCSQKSEGTNSSDDKVIFHSEVLEDIISISSDTQESSNAPEENLQPVLKPEQTDKSETGVEEKVVEIFMEKSILPKSSNEEILLDDSARASSSSTTIIKYDFEVKINDSSHAKETESEIDNSDTNKTLTEARKSQASGATSTEITSKMERDLKAAAALPHQEEKTEAVQNNPTQVSEELVKVLDEVTEIKETKSNNTALVLRKLTVSESSQESANKEEISTSSARSSRKINKKTIKQKLEIVQQKMEDDVQISEETIPDESEKPKMKRTTSESSQGSVKDDENCSRTRRGGRRKIQKAIVEETVAEQREECEEHTAQTDGEPQAKETRTDSEIRSEEISATELPPTGKLNIPNETDTQSNENTTSQTEQITAGKDSEALHESVTKPNEEHVIEQYEEMAQLENEIQSEEETKEIDEIQKERTNVETAEHATSIDSTETTDSQTENQIEKQVATPETSTSPTTVNEECLTKALTPESEVETIDAASENQFIAIVSQETSLAALIEEENSDVSKEIFAEMSKTPDEEQMIEKPDEVTQPGASGSSCVVNLDVDEEQIVETPPNVIEISEDDEDATCANENLPIVEEVAKHQTAKRGRRKPTISESSQDSDHKVSSSSKMTRRKIQKTPVEEVVIEEIEEHKAVTSVKTVKMNVEVEEASNEAKIYPAIEQVDSKGVEIAEAQSSTLRVQQQEPKRTRRKASVSESSQGSIHENDTIRTRRGRRKPRVTSVEDVLIEEEHNEENTVQVATIAESDQNQQKTEKKAKDTSSKLDEIENKIKSDGDNIDNPPQEVESLQSIEPDLKLEHEEHQAQLTECQILEIAEDGVKNEETKPTPSKRGRKKKNLPDPTARRRGRPKLQVTKAEAAAQAKAKSETEQLEDAKSKENEIESTPTEEQTIQKIDEVSNEKMSENDEQENRELPAPEHSEKETNEAKQFGKSARLRKLEVENEMEKDKVETNTSYTTRRGRRHNNNAESSETSVAATLPSRSTNRNRKTPVEQSTEIHQEEQLVKEVSADSVISKTSAEEPQKETVEIEQPPESAENIANVTEKTDDSKSLKETKYSADEDEKQTTCAESSTGTSEVVVPTTLGDEKSTKKRTRAQKTKIEESHKEETELKPTNIASPKTENENMPSHDEEVEQQISTKRRAVVKHVQPPELSAKSKRIREAAEHDGNEKTHTENIVERKIETEVAALSEEKASEVNLQPEPSLDHQNTSQAQNREVKTRKARRNPIIEVTHPEDDETLSPSKRKAVVKHIKQDHNESGPSSKRRVGRKNQIEEKHAAEVDKVAQTDTLEIVSEHHSIVEGIQKLEKEDHLSVMNREEEENKTNLVSSTNKKEESQQTETGETSSRRRNAGKRKPDYKEDDDDDTQVLKKTKNVEAPKNVENITSDSNEGKVKQDAEKEDDHVEQQPQVSTKKVRGRKKKNDRMEEDEQSAVSNSPETKDNKSRKRKQSHTDIQDQTTKGVDETDEKITKQTEANMNIPSDIIEHQTPKSSAPAAKKVRKPFEHITAESEEVDDTPGRRGRNLPQRRAATAYHNYDETSDTEISTKAKKKTDSPKKSPTTTATLAPIVSFSPSLSSAGLITTARGRTRKPTAKVQQFLEEERAKAETPKRRALLAAAAAAATAAVTNTTTTTSECATPQRTPARRGRKPSTIETEVDGTPHTSKSRGKAKSAILLTKEDDDTSVAAEITTVVEEKEIELQTTPPPANSVKSRRGRKPKITEEQPHISEEPPAKKMPVELESEKQDATPAVPVSTPPTRVAGKRNAAAAAKARIEEDALAAAAASAIEPPKRSRAKKSTPKVSTPAVTTTDTEADEKDGGNKTQTPSQKREHRLTSASTVEGVEDLQDDTEMEIKDKPANKRARKPAAATKTAEEGEKEEPLPVKRGRKHKIVDDMVDYETPQQSSKTTRVRGKGRKNVQFDGHQEAEATPSHQQNPTDIKPVPAETSSEPLKKSTRTRRK